MVRMCEGQENRGVHVQIVSPSDDICKEVDVIIVANPLNNETPPTECG